MQVMKAGSAKIPTALISITPSGITCQAELFIGPDENTRVSTSGLIALTSTGEEQYITLPIVIPSVEYAGAVYHAYIDVYVDSVLIASYQGIDDILIPSINIGDIVWS